MAPASANPQRTVSRLYSGLLIVGLIAMLGLGVDAALLVGNYRLGQAALDQAALAASAAVDVVQTDETTTLELRLTDAPDRPSAYTLAQQALDRAGLQQVTITDVVSDGRRVLVRGEVASPVLFARLAGVETISFSLVSAADLRPLPGVTP